MKRLNQLLLIIAIMLFMQTSYAQRTGLLFNKEAYEKVPMADFEALGWGKDKLPKDASLKQWAPIPGDQGDYGTCVGWSTAYGALTMQFARKFNVTDREQITLSAFCPYYLYNGFKDDFDFFCQSGGFFEDALEVLYQHGAKRYYTPEYSCYTSFDSYSPEAAQNFRIENYYRLFDWEQTMMDNMLGVKSERVQNVKTAIAEGNPVLIGAYVPNSFTFCMGTDVWKPTEEEFANYDTYGGHAMVAIGYDDSKHGGAFQVLNSWGTAWGDGGFIWVPYDAFDRFIHTAFYFELDDAFTPTSGCVFGDCNNEYSRYAWSANETYEGELSSGMFHGYGIYTAEDGSAYAGEWEDGFKDGKGVYVDPSGYTMTGYWEGGEYAGVDPPQDDEEGEDFFDWSWLFDFDEDSTEDETTETPTSGCIEGDCDYGYGTFIYSDGDVYQGYFFNGYRHGFGTYEYVEGDVYKGEWSNGSRNGIGKYIWPSGNIYIGEWKTDAQDGYGAKFFLGGQVDAGEWVKGVFQTDEGFGFAGTADQESVNKSNFAGVKFGNDSKVKEAEFKHNRIIMKQGSGFGNTPKSGLGTPMDPYYKPTRKVLDDILRAIGKIDLRNPPLNIISNDKEVAYINKDGINVSTRFIDLCRGLGEDSLDALAFVLAHEIGHHEQDHFFAREFGSAYASTEWGQHIRSAYDTIRNIGYYETEADEFGLFFSYTAGYNTMDVAPKVIDAVYREFGLPDEIPGYPPKDFRKQQAKLAKEKVNQLIPVFEVANYMNLLASSETGDMREDIIDVVTSCYDHILESKIQSVEIYNNLGINMINKAMFMMGSEEVPFALPLELDFEGRLSDEGGTKGWDDDLGWGDDGSSGWNEFAVRETLEQAARYFDLCLKIEQKYLPAMNNLAAVNLLLKEYDEAWAKARKVARLASESEDEFSLRNSYDILALTAYYLDEQEDAEEYLNLALEMGSKAAAYNRGLLMGTGNSLAAETSEFDRPVFTQLEKISGKSLLDVTNEYLYNGKPIETWDVVPSALQIGQTEYENDKLLILVTLERRRIENSYSFYVVDEHSDKTTIHNIRNNDKTDAVIKAYGDPVQVVSANRHDYWIYFDNNIIFRVDQDDRVSGWILYEIS